MNPPYFRMLSAVSVGIEDDRRVEVAEEEDARRVEQEVERVPHRRADSATRFIQSAPEIWREVRSEAGRIEIAKMTGMTPPVLTRSGRYVFWPP